MHTQPLAPFRWLALIALSLALIAAQPALADSPPKLQFETQEIDPHVGNVCYALTTADVNGDGKPDIVAVTEDAVVWFQNPTWQKHEITRGKTERDNVCIAAHDLDGDGQIDFALGAGWRPTDTTGASTLQWLGRDKQGAWQLHPIECTEPTVHRMRWGDVTGDGKPELVVVPLQGRKTKAPNWGEGPGVKTLVYSIPANPASPDWPLEVADDSVHTVHNFQLVNLDADPALEVLLAGWEGVFLLNRAGDGTWSQTKLGEGYQSADLPNKGASEIKIGRLPSGKPVIATVEPWHGRQVVLYEPKPDTPTDAIFQSGLWNRRVLDDGVMWGHTVWMADLDDQSGDELIIAQRDARTDDLPPKGPGIWVYQFAKQADGTSGNPLKLVVDDGGMACEDVIAADLDGDGQPDLVGGGRATHNVKIYWNKTAKPEQGR